jgi:ribonuclease BN (tRNA processing enzyme)
MAQGSIRWTTLGNAPYPQADNPCSGYLLQAGGANVLVDIGGGVLPLLQHYIKLVDLHAVWISHMHADHFADLPSLYYAFAFAGITKRKIPVMAPAGWAARVEAFVRSASEHDMRTCFNVVELKDRGVAEIGDLRLQARAVEHGVPSFGLVARIGDKRLAYSGDTGPCDNLVSLAKGANVLVAEAGADELEIPSLHLSPEDAGITAALGKVGRLVLTHLAPTLNADTAIGRASVNFNGGIEVAAPGHMIEI